MESIALGMARLAAGLFTGAAVYISLVEQPVRMHAQSSAAILQFRGSLPRAERMQPGLLLFTLMAAAWAYSLQSRPSLLAGGSVLLLILPLSFAWLVPINRRLLSGAPEDHIEQGMHLVSRWGKLHAFRSMLALAGTALLHL